MGGNYEFSFLNTALFSISFLASMGLKEEQNEFQKVALSFATNEMAPKMLHVEELNIVKRLNTLEESETRRTRGCRNEVQKQAGARHH